MFTLRFFTLFGWLMIVSAGGVQAQWKQEFSRNDYYQRWAKAAGPYGPEKAIGASSLVFGPGDNLYLACEKYADLVILPPAGPPRHVRLDGIASQPNEKVLVDIEAMCVLGDDLFLMDEDQLVIYRTSATDPGAVETLSVSFPRAINANMVRRSVHPNNGKNYASLEGLVVSSSYYGPEIHREVLAGKGPYYYLLDERDLEGGLMKSKLYVGIRNGHSIAIHDEPVVFELEDPKVIESESDRRFRLCELFEYRGALYALKTRVGEYNIVRCNVNDGTLTVVSDFTAAANALPGKKFDNNFEGAAVHSDGRIFLVTDNENFEAGGNGSPPERQDRRHRTTLTSLSPL